MERTIKRGEIYYAKLNPIVGSEQGGKHTTARIFLFSRCLTPAFPSIIGYLLFRLRIGYLHSDADG